MAEIGKPSRQITTNDLAVNVREQISFRGSTLAAAGEFI